MQTYLQFAIIGVWIFAATFSGCQGVYISANCLAHTEQFSRLKNQTTYNPKFWIYVELEILKRFAGVDSYKGWSLIVCLIVTSEANYDQALIYGATQSQDKSRYAKG